MSNKDTLTECAVIVERVEHGLRVLEQKQTLQRELTKAKRNAEIWKQLATDALLVLRAFSVGHSTQLAIEAQLRKSAADSD